MIKVKDLSVACEITNRKMSDLLRNLGINVLLNEATRLQSIYYFDRKMIPPKTEIDTKFVKEAYEYLIQEES